MHLFKIIYVDGTRVSIFNDKNGFNGIRNGIASAYNVNEKKSRDELNLDMKMEMETQWFKTIM